LCVRSRVRIFRLRAAQHFVTTISSTSGDDIVWKSSK
jgi:hypothetical protein